MVLVTLPSQLLLPIRMNHLAHPSFCSTLARASFTALKTAFNTITSSLMMKEILFNYKIFLPSLFPSLISMKLGMNIKNY